MERLFFWRRPKVRLESNAQRIGVTLKTSLATPSQTTYANNTSTPLRGGASSPSNPPPTLSVAMSAIVRRVSEGAAERTSTAFGTDEDAIRQVEHQLLLWKRRVSRAFRRHPAYLQQCFAVDMFSGRRLQGTTDLVPKRKASRKAVNERLAARAALGEDLRDRWRPREPNKAAKKHLDLASMSISKEKLQQAVSEADGGNVSSALESLPYKSMIEAATLRDQTVSRCAVDLTAAGRAHFNNVLLQTTLRYDGHYRTSLQEILSAVSRKSLRSACDTLHFQRTMIERLAEHSMFPLTKLSRALTAPQPPLVPYPDASGEYLHYYDSRGDDAARKRSSVVPIATPVPLWCSWHRHRVATRMRRRLTVSRLDALPMKVLKELEAKKLPTRTYWGSLRPLLNATVADWWLDEGAGTPVTELDRRMVAVALETLVGVDAHSTAPASQLLSAAAKGDGNAGEATKQEDEHHSELMLDFSKLFGDDADHSSVQQLLRQPKRPTTFAGQQTSYRNSRILPSNPFMCTDERTTKHTSVKALELSNPVIQSIDAFGIASLRNRAPTFALPDGGETPPSFLRMLGNESYAGVLEKFVMPVLPLCVDASPTILSAPSPFRVASNGSIVAENKDGGDGKAVSGLSMLTTLSLAAEQLDYSKHEAIIAMHAREFTKQPQEVSAAEESGDGATLQVSPCSSEGAVAPPLVDQPFPQAPAGGTTPAALLHSGHYALLMSKLRTRFPHPLRDAHALQSTAMILERSAHVRFLEEEHQPLTTTTAGGTSSVGGDSMLHDSVAQTTQHEIRQLSKKYQRRCAVRSFSSFADMKSEEDDGRSSCSGHAFLEALQFRSSLMQASRADAMDRTDAFESRFLEYRAAHINEVAATTA